MQLHRPVLTKQRYEKLKSEGTTGEIMIAVGMMMRKLDQMKKQQLLLAKDVRSIKHTVDDRLRMMENRDLTLRHQRHMR